MGHGGRTEYPGTSPSFPLNDLQLTSSRLCACDIPAHSYQYSFNPNPHWTNFYAPSKEIREYLGGIAEKYGVTRYVKLSHKVTSCIWDDATKKWYEDDGCPTLPFSQWTSLTMLDRKIDVEKGNLKTERDYP